MSPLPVPLHSSQPSQLHTTSQKLTEHPCWQSPPIQVGLGIIAFQKPSHHLLPTDRLSQGLQHCPKGLAQVGTYSCVLALVLELPHPLTLLGQNWHLDSFERGDSQKTSRAFGVQDRAASGHNCTATSTEGSGTPYTPTDSPYYACRPQHMRCWSSLPQAELHSTLTCHR